MVCHKNILCADGLNFEGMDLRASYRFALRFHGVGGTGCRGSLACSARSSLAQRRARVTRSACVLRGVHTSGPSRPASNTLAIVGSANTCRNTSRASRHDVGHGDAISGGSSDRISYHPARRRLWFFQTYHDVMNAKRSSAFCGVVTRSPLIRPSTTPCQTMIVTSCPQSSSQSTGQPWRRRYANMHGRSA